MPPRRTISLENERQFGADDNIERFRTSVALGTLKRRFDVPLT